MESVKIEELVSAQGLYKVEIKYMNFFPICPDEYLSSTMYDLDGQAVWKEILDPNDYIGSDLIKEVQNRTNETEEILINLLEPGKLITQKLIFGLFAAKRNIKDWLEFENNKISSWIDLKKDVSQMLDELKKTMAVLTKKFVEQYSCIATLGNTKLILDLEKTYEKNYYAGIFRMLNEDSKCQLVAEKTFALNKNERFNNFRPLITWAQSETVKEINKIKGANVLAS